MKDDQVSKHCLSAIKDLIIEESKHGSVNCTILIEMKMKNKAMRFVQNFLVKIPNSYGKHSEFIIFSSNFSEVNGNKPGEDVVLLDGFTSDEKTFKKSIKWCLVEKSVSENLGKKKGVVNKKSLLPNNYESVSSIPIVDQIKDIYNGNAIKVVQVNNFFSFKCGHITKNTPEEMAANIEAVYKFVRFQMGHLVKRVYINQTMQKSKVICIRT